MLPWFSERFWNAASSHALGRIAADAVETARSQVARGIGSSANEIVWTAGATESNNLALKGLLEAVPPTRQRVLVGATEHKAILDVADWLTTRGYELDVVPVDTQGLIDMDVYRSLLAPDVAAVSIMAANNETGVIAPVAALAELAHEVGASFHTDATQALGRMSVDVRLWGIDAASFSAHKVYGPKGAGALYISRRTRLAPQIHGGGHERGMRSGTSNVPSIVGFGAAVETATASLAEDTERYAGLVQSMVDGFRAELPQASVLGPLGNRLSNTVNVHFPGADAEAVMANAPSVAVSSGSACSSLVPSASHVLRAMGLTEIEAFECIRFSVGRPTTAAEIDIAVTNIVTSVRRVQTLVSTSRGEVE